MAGKKIGTIFVELDLDPSRYTKGQQRLYKDATTTTLNIEANFKKLGIKSSAEMDLMRAKITNSFNMIKHSAQATANDIVRAEKAKTEQLNRLNEQQFGKQISLLTKLKQHWMGVAIAAYAAMRVIQAGWDLMEKAADYQERINSLDALGKQYGITGSQIITAMQEASRGLLSMKEASDLAASAMNLSLTPYQMIEFTKVAEKLTDVIGGSIPEAYNKLIVAAASGRLMTLAQMGIIVDLNAAYKAHGDKLTEAQKQQIRLNVILDAAKKKTDILGESVDTFRDKMDRLIATKEDMKLMFGQILIRGTMLSAAGFNYLAAGILGLTSAYLRYRALVYQVMGDEKKQAENLFNANAAFGARNELLKKSSEYWDAAIASANEFAGSLGGKGFTGLAPIISPTPITDPKKQLDADYKYALEQYSRQIDAADAFHSDLEIGQKEHNQVIWDLDQKAITDKLALFDTEYKYYIDQYSRILDAAEAFYSDIGEAAKEANKTILDLDKESKNDMLDAMKGWASNWSSTLNDMLWGAKTTFKDIVISFGKMLTQMMIQKKIVEPFFIAMESGKGASIFSSIASWFGFSKGAILEQNKVTPFASGTVLTKPAIFPMANGYGLAGERGPEGILPLKRNTKGELGVINAGDKTKDKGGVTVVMNNPVFQDLETQQKVFEQIATVIAYRVAPGAVIQSYDNGEQIRDVIRGRY